MVTVVEFFDKNAIENVCSLLLCDVDKIVFIGDKGKTIQEAIDIYSEIVERKNKRPELCKQTANRHKLESVVSVLQKIVDECDQCVFDLTGGDELYLVAVGMVYLKNRDKVQLHRFNVNGNKLVDCDADGNLLDCTTFDLRVEDNIKLYGGKILYDEREDATYRWEFTENFEADILKMWEICKKDNRLWNMQMTALGEYLGKSSELNVSIDRKGAVSVLEAKKIRPVFDEGLFLELENHGLIKNVKSTSTEIEFSFKNEQVMKCLRKAGQILELFVTLCARKCQNENGTPYFGDVVCGAVLDWDGCYVQATANVDNEIDVLLMKNFIPVFISCKNGDVKMEELYKLNTVALRFGGKYAKKVLVAPELDGETPAGKSIELRAKELGIRVIDNKTSFSSQELIEILSDI